MAFQSISAVGFVTEPETETYSSANPKEMNLWILTQMLA